ncbi:MAG TPA: hypothetical protein VM425_02855 [Myxococcota bacterium]|nr:hypothetical protein [Myxococcota bacterium]
MLKASSNKYFWLVNLLFLALGAWLIAGIINALTAHEIRASEQPADLTRPLPTVRKVFPKGDNNRIIVERNYFESTVVKPDEPELSPEVKALLDQIEPHLNRKTIDRIFAVGKAFEKDEGLFLHCNIVEGRFCYFVESEMLATYDGTYDPKIENEVQRLSKDLAIAITDQVGAKHIEHARNNGVKIRCTRLPPTCEVDWGWGKGWQPLSIR